ncbi:hypothetical protein SAMN05421847_1431 [Halpernia humi]|uniref:Uncharacterized protein n=1 Tax=Halpernia humi TaxID=493375 RepID=A0A1H5X509_9FLAO|nr:hypothetical protein [Halpernia humi]SEG06457.1 hypothetical protein SAMN05421847_1431 [Halpernia humi]
MKTWIPIFNPVLHYYSLEKLLFMTKFLIILIALYILYYIGNIVYDLFIKKESTLVTEESDVFSLAEFEEQNRDDVTTVGIEDVENLNTPKSFNKREFPVSNDLSEDREDIEVWRQRFESEQNIDSFESGILSNKEEEIASVKIIEENSNDQGNTEDEDADDHNESIDKSLEAANIQVPRKVDNAQFREMFNQAETIVQTIEHEDGRKVFQNRAVQK